MCWKNKQVKRSIRADDQKNMEGISTAAEKVAREGHVKQLYDTTEKLAERYIKPERPVNNEK